MKTLGVYSHPPSSESKVGARVALGQSNMKKPRTQNKHLNKCSDQVSELGLETPRRVRSTDNQNQDVRVIQGHRSKELETVAEVSGSGRGLALSGVTHTLLAGRKDSEPSGPTAPRLALPKCKSCLPGLPASLMSPSRLMSTLIS